jgi:hypothetical protein
MAQPKQMKPEAEPKPGAQKPADIERKKMEEAKKKADEESKRKVDQDAKQKKEEAARKQAEMDAKKKQEEEAKKKMVLEAEKAKADMMKLESVAKLDAAPKPEVPQTPKKPEEEAKLKTKRTVSDIQEDKAKAISDAEKAKQLEIEFKKAAKPDEDSLIWLKPEMKKGRAKMQVVVVEQKFVHPERLKPEDERAKEIPYGGSPKLYKITLNIFLNAEPPPIHFDIFFLEPRMASTQAIIQKGRIVYQEKAATKPIVRVGEEETLKRRVETEKGGEAAAAILQPAEEYKPSQKENAAANLPKAVETPKFTSKFEHTEMPQITIEPSLSADDIMYTSTSSTTSEQVNFHFSIT